MQAIQILDIERVKGLKDRLFQCVENHRVSADEAGDIHDLHEVFPIIQNKLFENIARSFVAETLQDRAGFFWLAYLEEYREMGVHRADMLLEQGASAGTAVSS